MNPNAARDLQRIAELMQLMREMQAKPALRELASDEMKQREDRRHQMATALRIKGLPVRPEYQPNGNS